MKLYKNGQPLIISSDGGLILEANNPFEFQFAKATKTYTITFPNTGNNNILLDNIFYRNYELNTVFDDIEIEMAGGIWIKGRLVMRSWDQKEAKGQFVSTNETLIKSLQTTNMKDVVMGMGHIVNSTNIAHSQNVDLEAEGVPLPVLESGNIVYGYIDRGKTRSQIEREKNSNSSPYRKGIDMGEVFPSVRLKKIIEQIFDGYDLEGNLFDYGDWDKVYLLFTGKNRGISNPEAFEVENRFISAQPDYDFISAVVSAPQIFTNVGTVVVLEDPATGYNSGAKSYTVQESGVFNCQLKLNGTGEDILENYEFISGSITLEMFRNGNPLRSFEANHIWKTEGDYLRNDTGDYTFRRYIDTGNIYLEVGDVITFQFKYEAETFEPGVGDYRLRVTAEDMEFNLIPTSGHGALVPIADMKVFMPDMKAVDFVKAILKEFSCELYITESDNRAIFHNRVGVEEVNTDITPKIVAGSIRSNIRQPENIEVRRIDDTDDVLLTDNPKDEYIRLIDNDARETEVIELPFAYLYEQAINRWGVTVPMPVLWKDRVLPDFETEFEMRIGYIDQAFTTADIELLGRQTVSAVTNIRGIRTKSNNGNLLLNDSAEDAYDLWHSQNISDKNNGISLDCEMLLDADFINGIYYLQAGKDWRNVMQVRVPGFMGFYKLLKLELINKNLYRANMYGTLPGPPPDFPHEVTLKVEKWEISEPTFEDQKVEDLEGIQLHIGPRSGVTNSLGEVTTTLPTGTHVYSATHAQTLTTFRGVLTIDENGNVTGNELIKLYDCKYTIQEIDDLIEDGYVPVWNASELDSLRLSTVQTMGDKSIWRALYTTGLDKKYVQVGNIQSHSYGTLDFTSGGYDGNELTIKTSAGNIFRSTAGTTFFKNIIGVTDGIIGTSSSIPFAVVLRSISIGATSTIENIKTYGNVECSGDVNESGGVIGFLQSTTSDITNSHNHANITGTNFVGGVVGRNFSDITNSHNYADITGNDYVGGVVGSLESASKITHSSSDGYISGVIRAGGLAGRLFGDSEAIKCYSKGTVYFTSVFSGGGITANLWSTGNNKVIDCWSSCDIINPNNVIDGAGGLVGRCVSSTIINSFAYGNVSVGSGASGGLVGTIQTSTITNSYYDTDTSNQSDTGKGEPRTTIQKQEATADSFILPAGGEDTGEDPDNAMYTDWSDLIWEFTPTNEYPKLK